MSEFNKTLKLIWLS